LTYIFIIIIALNAVVVGVGVVVVVGVVGVEPRRQTEQRRKSAFFARGRGVGDRPKQRKLLLVINKRQVMD
jgi:hypothetical protein